MRLKFSSDQKSLLGLIRSELPPGQDIFLVGGAVRDALLGLENHDLDFALSQNPTRIAKRLAQHLDAGFFVLDDERHTARVLYQTTEDVIFPLDFVQFTGDSLFTDLHHRDFTINAMAVSLDDLGNLIDPLNGEIDLENQIIKTCAPQSLIDDPVRVLRAIRLAYQLGCSYADGMEDLLVDATRLLPETSSERQRDEFFKILDGPEPHQAIRDCQRFQITQVLFPALSEQEKVPAKTPHIHPLFEHTIHAIKFYHQIIGLLGRNELHPEMDKKYTSSLFSILGSYSGKIRSYFTEAITQGRKKSGLALFGALLHDVGKPLTLKIGEDGQYHYYGHDKVGADLAWKAAKKLALSNAESDWVKVFVQNHMDLLTWSHSDELPSRRGIYRFFQRTGEVGVAIGLFYLADTLATYGEGLLTEKWEKNLRIVAVLLENWWENKTEVISPKPLLNGYDLQKKFGLEPGEIIGKLLANLIEAQASGEVATVQDAESFIKEKLEEGG